MAVAHRAFHRWKRPAPRVEARQYIIAPHNEKVVIHAEMRFLRFQAPWALGKKVFVLLRSALVERWVNIRHRLMDVAEKRARTHSHGARHNLTNIGFGRWENVLSRLKNWGMVMRLSGFGGASKRDFSKRRAWAF